MKLWRTALCHQHVDKPAQCAGSLKALPRVSKHTRSTASPRRCTVLGTDITPPRSEPIISRSPCRIQRPRHITNFSSASATATTPAATVTAPSHTFRKNLAIKSRDADGSGSEVVLDSLLVRDSCRCRLCVDPFSQQKLFQTADIPTSIAGRIDDEHSEVIPSATTSYDGEKGVMAIVSWVNDVPGYPAEHITELTAEMLASMAVLSSSSSSHSISSSIAKVPKKAKDTRIPWTAVDMARTVQWFDYDKYVGSDETLFAVLEALRVYGLAFLRGVPDSMLKKGEQPSEAVTVECIAERIGSLRNSFYGRSWDVRSVPGATNVAYTHQYLGLHMDLLYMANPPRLQLLHCLRATSPGGVSLFSDTLAAANTIRHTSLPEQFTALTTYPVPYHYRNAGQHYRSARPTIELGIAPLDFDLGDAHDSNPGSEPDATHLAQNLDSATTAPSSEATMTTTTTTTTKDDMLLISHTNYSPPFQAPFYSPAAATRLLNDSIVRTTSSSSPSPSSSSSSSSLRHPTDLRAYHESSRSFTALLEHPSAIYEHRLAEGELVIFDNRRVAHARTAFEVGIGERWLKGAYVDGDVWVSRWRGLKKKDLEKKRE